MREPGFVEGDLVTGPRSWAKALGLVSRRRRTLHPRCRQRETGDGFPYHRRDSGRLPARIVAKEDRKAVLRPTAASVLDPGRG
jgi:hypothetical protein